MKQILSARNLTKVVGTAANPVTALENFDIDLHAGEVLLIRGPSGSGKTTLLQVLGTLTQPTSGSIMILNEPIPPKDPKQLGRLRRAFFGFIFQDFQLIRSLTTLENVMLPLFAIGSHMSEATRRADHLLNRFDLGHRRNSPVESLSGGEKQRTAIARALVNDPKVILADEPTANLDTENGQQVMELLRTSANSGLGVIVASHDERTLPYADRQILLRDGRLERTIDHDSP